MADRVLERLGPKNIWSQRDRQIDPDRQICLTEMKVKEAKKKQRKQGCGEERGGSETKREQEASAEKEEGARPGRRIYIFFMILFNLTRLTAEQFPSQVLPGGGCAQKADRLKLLP